MTATCDLEATITDGRGGSNTASLTIQIGPVQNSQGAAQSDAICSNLVMGDPGSRWRLPKLDELFSLADLGVPGSCEDATVFTNSFTGTGFWTSDCEGSCAADGGVAWSAQFSDTLVYIVGGMGTTDEGSTWCVH